jgi:hypothetical protein
METKSMRLGWVAGLFSVIVIGVAFEAQADRCEDPDDGPRACDKWNSDCPYILNYSGPTIYGRFHSDYASQLETAQYLVNLDNESFDADDYMSRIDLGKSFEMVYSYETDWLK